MVRNKKKIIAIGGGGFTHRSDKDLDDYVINQVNKSIIEIGFLATASNDDQVRIDLFYNRFKSQNLKLSHFNLCSKVDGFANWVLKKDLIYIGGGNTFNMIELWKKYNLVNIFKNAYEKGVILSGVSAGGACWFDWILSDSLNNKLSSIEGINLISGSCTPHASDKSRLKQFINNIKKGDLHEGIAIDDGVAVLFIDGIPSDVYSSRINHGAYYVNKHDTINLKTYIKNLNG